MMDRNAPPDLLEDTATSLAESEELCSRWHGACGGRLRYAFTPRFAVTCSEELLRGAGRLAQGSSALVQTHLAENLDELRTVAGLFPDAPHYTGVYERAGLLGPQTVMAHCLYLSDGEWDLLARTGTRIAHCPRSNFLLRSGVFDMAQARSRALAVGLGTDVGAGPNLSLPEEMAAACFASRARETLERAAAARLDSLRSDLAAMPGGAELLETIRSRLQLGDTVTLVGPKMAFYLATLGSARVLGLADQIGSLEPGKQADFVVVDLNATEVDPIAAQSSEELVCQFTHHAAALAVRAVFIGGRCVHPPEPVRPR
jgi:guanine deaminase